MLRSLTHLPNVSGGLISMTFVTFPQKRTMMERPRLNAGYLTDDHRMKAVET
jgi:hypothetical protein